MMKQTLVAGWAVTLGIAFLIGYAASAGGVGSLLARQPASGAQAPLAGALPPGDYSRIEVAPGWVEPMAWFADDMVETHVELVARVARGEPGAGVSPPDLFQPFVTRTHSFIMVHRPELPEGQVPGGEQHEGVTDVYFIVGGGGELIVGGEIPNKRVSRPGEYGGTLNGGRRIAVKTGDIVNIPPDTPHATVPGPGGMTYVLMKVNVGLYPWSLINGTP